jgi:hypothetical protein
MQRSITAARFIGILIKDRLQVDAVQDREQQDDDCDRLQHANPPSGLIPHVSLPDVGKVRIAATSIIKIFNKLFLYQRPTYGTGLIGSIVSDRTILREYLPHPERGSRDAVMIRALMIVQEKVAFCATLA